MRFKYCKATFLQFFLFILKKVANKFAPYCFFSLYLIQVKQQQNNTTMETVINNLEEKIKSAFIRKSYYNAIAERTTDVGLKKHYLTQVSMYKLRMNILRETIELIEEKIKY